MWMTRWQPFQNSWAEMSRLNQEMNQLLDRFGRLAGPRWSESPSFPALNVWESDHEIYAEAELPGMQLEDLEIYVTGGNQLSIKGERKVPDVGTGSWHRRERGAGKFSRLVTLPVPVDADKVEAQFQHGVLTVRLPKSAAAKPRKITVKAE